MCRAVVSLACSLHHLALFTQHMHFDIFLNPTVAVCVDDGWLKQLHLA